MFQDLAGGRSFSWVKVQHRHEKIDAKRARGAKEPGKVIAVTQGGDSILCDGDVAFQRRDAGPVLLGRSADRLADEIDLVDVSVARHEGSADDEFRKNGAHGPDVDGSGVVSGLEEQFGRPVPAGDNVVSHGQVWVGEGAGETEVG